MPAGATVMTRKERLVAREEAEPVVTKVRNLLLRGGARGIIEYQRGLNAACEGSHAVTGASSAATTRPPADPALIATQRKPTAVTLRRLNPEDLKTATRDAGVLLSPTEYKTLLLAFADAVGFVLVDPYVSALSASSNANVAKEEEALLALFPGCPSRSAVTVETEGESCVSLPGIALNSLLNVLVALFAPLEPDQADGQLSVDANNASAQLQLAYEDAADAFTLANYPAGHVPGQSVLSFLLAVIELNASHRLCVETLRQRVREVKGSLEAAAAPGPASTTAVSGTAPATTSTMVHTGVRSQRKFEYYQEEDRRDEWIRGRDEKDAGKAYQRHIVGYAGHLPEYQYHFGRTFHVIEEDLPLLSKPKPPLEQAPADAYGRARELKESRMNAHHYKLA